MRFMEYGSYAVSDSAILSQSESVNWNIHRPTGPTAISHAGEP